jgi:hypothetical protein
VRCIADLERRKNSRLCRDSKLGRSSPIFNYLIVKRDFKETSEVITVVFLADSDPLA